MRTVDKVGLAIACVTVGLFVIGWVIAGIADWKAHEKKPDSSPCITAFYDHGNITMPIMTLEEHGADCTSVEFTIYNSDESVARFFVKDGCLHFNGNADASARTFIRALQKTFDGMVDLAIKQREAKAKGEAK